jgi:hypothetical protein
MSRPAHLRQEEGAALIMVTAVMLLLLGITALAIDLGALRLDRRVDRLASDLAATAGAGSIEPLTGSAGDIACQTAWEYVLLNLADEGTTLTPPVCTDFPVTCDPITPHTEVGQAGEYHVEITFPVIDGHPLLDGQALNSEVDGSACQRFGVSIQRDRDFSFARVMGFDTGSTEVRSVARIGAGSGEGELVPLVLLEPYECETLYTSGQGRVTITPFDQSPGLIVVDSEASNCGPSSPYSIDSQGTIQGWIRALPVPGQDNSAILTYALSGAYSAVAADAYDPSDLTDIVLPPDCNDPVTCFRLFPRPIGQSQRVTRAPIDWRYDCNETYSDYLGIPISGCPDFATSPSHIDALNTAFGGLPGTQPTGIIQRWTDHYTCSPPEPTISETGDWWVDCPGTSGNQGFVVGNGTSVTFAGGNVVFDGQVRVFGSLTVNPGGADPSTGVDHVMYIRDGEFEKDAQANIVMEHVFVYLADGRIDFNGGSGGLNWSAPDGQGGDPWGPLFDDLALWSESTDRHRIGGQAGNTLEGTFFTPYASPFELAGQGAQFQTKAQFLTRQLELSGQAEVQMSPNPDRVTLIPIREIRLIR